MTKFEQNLLISILLITAIGCLYQPLLGTPFVVKSLWTFYGVTLSAIVTLACALLLKKMMANLTPKQKLAVAQSSSDQSKLLNKLSTPIFIVFLWFATYVTIAETGASLYTKYLGNDYKNFITILEEDDVSLGGRICAGRYRVKAPQMSNNSFLNVFCLHRDNKNLLKPPAIIHVQGRESFAGYTIQHFEVETQNLSPSEFNGLRAEAEKFWK